MNIVKEIKRAFSSRGGLAEAIDGFSPRQPQIDMACAVGEAIEHNSALIVEAGTGTGKTFAYLVPALLSEKKTIVSTGSKNLQDQLFKRDLPTIKKALNYSGKVALLKGRRNYLCLERLDRVIAIGVLGEKSVLKDLSTVRRWHTYTKTGDLTECTGLSEESAIIPQVTSTTDNCLGSECAYYNECFVVKARRRAMEADLLVVNHHLFCADMAVKENGFGELIPNAELVIFDEAHQLPEIATQYFGESLSLRQLLDLAKEANQIYRSEVRDAKQLGEAADKLQKAAQDWRVEMGEMEKRRQLKGNLRDLLLLDAVVNAMNQVYEALQFFAKVVETHMARANALQNIFERAITLVQRLDKMRDTHINGYCYWYEITKYGFSLHITPLQVADKFGDQLKKLNSGWVFTSATLAVNEEFSHFKQKMGLESAAEMILPSPFDYEAQALFCVPRYLPETGSDRGKRLGKMLLPLIEANRGRCFLLCTSYAMMNQLAEYLRSASALNVLLQGETTKGRLLEQFVQKENSVLVATQSFWEGIDVRGEALSLVIIDKIPFGSPSEPLFNARAEDCKRQGLDPFSALQIPEAVITLKQGVGRLIRDVTDWGVVVICDNRLVTREYGEVFVRSLPFSRRTRDLDFARQFLIKKTQK